MTAFYTRSEIMDFYDLSDEQQKYFLSECEDSEDIENVKEDKYVKCGEDVFSLSEFVRIENNPIWAGEMGSTNSSGYLIALSKDNREAVVAYKYFT